MDFTEVYKQSAYLSHFSPDSQFVATAVQQRLVIRSAATLQIFHIFQSSQPISTISWSGNSLYIAAASKEGLISVWNLARKEAHLRLDLAPSVADKLVWSPDSHSLVAFCDLQARAMVCSISSRTVVTIDGATSNDKAGSIFRMDGQFAAIPLRLLGKDHIAIYEVTTWSQAAIFLTETEFLDGLAWSPDGQYIAAWQNTLEYKLLIYTPTGRRLASRHLHDDALGIRSVAWHPDSRFIAVASYDSIVRIYTSKSWSLQCELLHPHTLRKGSLLCKEPYDARQGALNQALEPGSRGIMTYDRVRATTSFPLAQLNNASNTLKIGAGSMTMSPDGRFLAVRNDEIPDVVWIWEFDSIHALDIDSRNPSLAVVLQQWQSVRSIEWQPATYFGQGNQLAIGCATGIIFFWSEGKPIREKYSDLLLDDAAFDRDIDGRSVQQTMQDLAEARQLDRELKQETPEAIAVELPLRNFIVNTMRWRADGQALLLMNRDSFCCAYLVDDDDDSGSFQGVNFQEQLQLSD